MQHRPIGDRGTRRGKWMAIWLLPIAASSAVVAGDGSTPDDVEAAVRWYDDGRYAEAREVLERANIEGRMTGPLLYRLAYARGRTGDPTGKEQIEPEALSTLEREYSEEPTLEVAFYLSNAYRNARRPADSVRVAKGSTERIESEEWATPESAIGLFWVGKLYEDQARRDRLQIWYRRALEAMEAEPGRYGPYRLWAHRNLAAAASHEARFEDAERHLAAMLELDEGTAVDWDRLATMRARLRRWADARDAWRRAERMDPANGDRPRYCANIASLATEIEDLPTIAPSGKAYSELAREDLEDLMKSRSDEVRSAVEEATSADDARRAELQAGIDAAKLVFVAAAMEYAVRGLPIRETAFFGGYAPLIFHSNRWRLPD